MTESAGSPDVGRVTELRTCERCGVTYVIPPHRLAALAARGVKPGRFCLGCQRWRREPRRERYAEMLESALPQLLLAGHPQAERVLSALETGSLALQRRVCAELARAQVAR